MTDGLIITLDNGESKITIGDENCQFLLLEHDGFEAADYDVKTVTSGASDGVYISTHRLGERTISIKFDYSWVGMEISRSKLIKFFSPNRNLNVIVDRRGTTREISGVASDFKIDESNLHEFSIVKVSILCPDPYFKSVDTVFRNSAVSKSAFHLPCKLPCIVGVQSGTGFVDVINDGDTYADMVVELIVSAPITAPYVYNRTNGKKIKILDSLDAGDKVVISTVRRAKKATVNGERANIDPTSVFSDFLERGLNQIDYGSEDGSDMIAANLTYTALYLGV